MGAVRYLPLYFDNAKTIGAQKDGADLALFNGSESIKLADLLDKVSMRPITTKTANYTATSSDYQILADATSGNITITIPDSTSNTDLYNSSLGVSKVFNIKKIDSSTTNTVTLARSGAQLIEGATSFVMDSPGEVVELQTDGTNWYITAKFRGLYW